MCDHILTPASEFWLNTVKMKKKTGRKQLNHFLYMTVLDGETLTLGDIVFSIKQTGATQSKSYQGENLTVFILEPFFRGLGFYDSGCNSVTLSIC
jgi:hypothetical protein